MSAAITRLGQVRLVAATVVLTSLAWIGGLAAWLPRRAAELPPAVQAAPQPVLMSPAKPPARPSGQLVIPVAGTGPAALTDTFTQARAGGERIHDAIDIMAPRGTPVVAAAAGRVEKLFLSKDGGQTVYVRSPDGRLQYYYAHLDSYAPGLAEGQQVTPGMPLGTVGTTGNADPSAPHLHFAISATAPESSWYAPVLALNPYPLLKSGQLPELGTLTQRSAASLPSAASRRRNERPERAYTAPTSGPEVNSTRSPVIR